MFESLNNYAGLFSLLAVLAAIIVPCVIYKKERKAKRQAMQDELDALNGVSRFPMTYEERKFYAKKSALEQGLRRK